METIDCLFIHVPKETKESTYFINYMPMGLVPIADLIERNGFNTKIIHLGLKKLKDPNFSLEDYLSKRQVKVIALSLHWHPQTSSVIEAIKKIKRASPNSFIVLGGFTASFFHEELLKNFLEIDAIIRGDGEKPMLELIRELNKTSPNFGNVPNLVWRQDSKIISNQNKYVATEDDLSKLKFNFKLVEDYDDYLRIKWETKKEDYLKNQKSACLSFGRGCNGNCSYCGGSRISQELINFRKNPVFMPLKNAVNLIKTLKEDYSLEYLYMVYDPCPNNPSYYLELFKQIKNEKIDLGAHFESWGLPTKEFVDSFAKTFNHENAAITLSPETASEKIRGLNKTFYYSNRDLIKKISEITKKKIGCSLAFGIGLPFQDEDELNKTILFAKDLKRKEYSVSIINSPIVLDPASPMYLNPTKYGVKIHNNSLKDFIESHKCRPSTFILDKTNAEKTLGYNTDKLSSEQILEYETKSRIIFKQSERYF
jgi:radical SAM superfamily enzyme YgiQ (UPF0313 family)